MKGTKNILSKVCIAEMNSEPGKFPVFIIHQSECDLVVPGEVAIKYLSFSCFKVYFYDIFSLKSP